VSSARIDEQSYDFSEISLMTFLVLELGFILVLNEWLAVVDCSFLGKNLRDLMQNGNSEFDSP
jgi:hypothetical protein